MKLWLDDERNPKSPLIQQDFGAEGDEVWVKTAQVAINWLKQGNVEFISLDHDLGSQSCGTGMDVARWIEEEAYHGTLPKLNWAIHSKNPVGRQNMMRALIKADEYWEKLNVD